MKVSIVIPCYNAEKYIEQCIESILVTKLENVEIIAINDGSKDNTLKKLYEIKEKFNLHNLHILNQENQGLSETRNVGINIASGKYIVFIDNDDWVEHYYLDTLFEKIETGYDAVYVSYNRCYEKTKEPRILNLDGVYNSSEVKRRLLGLYEKELSDPSQADSIVTAWAKIYKVDIIKSKNIKFVSNKEIGTEDLLFNLQYVEYSNNILIKDIPIYNYRRNNIESLTSSYRPLLFQQWQKKYDYILKTISINTNEHITAFENRIALSIIGIGLNEINNTEGIGVVFENLNNYLNHPRYQKAYKTLDFKYFPIHWKLFFMAAKYKQVLILYLLLIGMNRIINKNSR
ncbi:glycosyltransferase family 2 protein [Epilithonimonas lactis]|uniref:Glycosyltransferase 2-like domain-containing protein n=1 Tax=Epilithonimonas lactis TaxID=421072 RepID=A0A085BL82_9FLAO|nr:glycosyltransferase [Epilithonimonas lactis]KFC23227.1 hypothetical protein IO89_01120 [Epilithonimonas lactis]SEQ05936.1 Glycosyl transferase family 2 [Epilithonimonas lactis]